MTRSVFEPYKLLTNFDIRKFKKEALSLFLILIVIFALTCISFCAQANTCVFWAIFAEPAG